MTTTRPALAAALALAAAALAGCAGAPSSASSPPSSDYVVASLKPTRGNIAAGTVFFSQEGGDVVMRGRITGLVANQKYSGGHRRAGATGNHTRDLDQGRRQIQGHTAANSGGMFVRCRL